MASDAAFLRAILPSLPNGFAKKVRALCGSTSESAAEDVLDTLIRFISGAECAPNATTDVQKQWNEKQQATTTILNRMVKGRSDIKRPRETEGAEQDFQASKRQRLSTETSFLSTSQALPTEPLFTIHSISATSPVRKKVDLTVHKTALVLTHPTTHAIEGNIPLSSITRAFLLPTRGKSKAHWTIVLLTSDSSERTKPANGTTQSNTQVIFGTDAVSLATFSSSIYDGTNPIQTVSPKGTNTRPFLLDFLTRLGTSVIEPTPDVFKSACLGITSGVSANEDGIPGIEAYRGAKSGSLWFTKEGILWGESKPCEFWALEDLIGKSDGVRVVGGAGRTCTVVITRKSTSESEDIGEDEEDMGVEAEFGMVDSKERSGIEAWARTFKHLFGKKKVVGEAKTINQVEDDSDEEDEDFEMDTDEELDGSEATSSDSDESDDDEGSVKDSEGSDAEGELGSDREEELKEEHHPLLRPGAMPRRMNRAVIDMVVGMVEDDMLETSGRQELSSVSEGDDEEVEEDELED
ncbi:hypothetical protein H0H87_002484 [Tephrocybe sp. NHM501043]|nr:hypothetical protein H0H87_002484 [Tephrocybe sp. NHM501043]